MSVRLIFIGLMVFLGFWYIAILLWLMNRLNKSSEYGISGEKNSQSGSGKMKISDLFFHILVIAIVFITVIKLMSFVGPAFASLGGMIVAIPVKALLNASGRKTNVILTLSGMALLFVYLCFWYILIGVPVKPPVMTVGGMKVTLSKTSVEDLLDNGFDIYIMNDENTYEYSEMLTSGSYTKYDENQDITVEKGYRSTGETLRGAPYLLVKDDTLIGAILSYRLRSISKWLVCVPPILANAIIIPFVLKYAYGLPDLIPYLMLTVGIGEVLAVAVLGNLLMLALEPKSSFIFGHENKVSQKA